MLANNSRYRLLSDQNKIFFLFSPPNLQADKQYHRMHIKRFAGKNIKRWERCARKYWELCNFTVS